MAVAGGITFFFLLALFPALGALVSLYGMFADRVSIAHVIDVTSPFLPGGAVTVLETELHRLVAQKPEKLNIGFIISLIVALWSSSGGVSALVDGLNIACETRETRGFYNLLQMPFSSPLPAFCSQSCFAILWCFFRAHGMTIG